MDDGLDGNVVHFNERARLQWQARCMLGSHGRLMPNLFNAMIALQFDEDVRDVIGFDEMLRTAVMQREIATGASCHRPLTDGDMVEMQRWMQGNGFAGIGLETVRNAMLRRAEECSFHPVRDYLRSLIWDGCERLSNWLVSYLGAELNDYTRHIGKLFLTSMVARVIEPGCQADHMIVLEGPQGVLKSSACRVLAGEWFSDDLPDIVNGREASQHLRGKWLIEVSEMHAMGKAEATQLKSFISRRVERYRPSYGRAEVFEPRQCVFIGTTNENEYLRDPSGGRRFWPVKVGVNHRIEIALLEEHRDQLFAEAVEVYRIGDPWFPDPSFEREIIMPEQAARQVGEIWEDRIREYLVGKERTTVADIARDALAIPSHQMSSQHQHRISGALREIGWVLKRSGTTRWWKRE